MGKKKICFIAQFPPPMHGLSKAVETLYDSDLSKEFNFEKVNITNNRRFPKNLVAIRNSNADLFYFTISQSRCGNLRDLAILKLLRMQHKKCLVHLHGGYYRTLVDRDIPDWQKKANYKAISKLDGAIVLGASLKWIFEGMLSNEKIYTVSNCVDDQYLMSNEDFEKKISTIDQRKVKHVLYLSNFIRTKGYSEVLEMARLEKERVEAGGERKFLFDFAGKFFERTEEQFFNAYVDENKLEDYVTYHGIVEGKKKQDLLLQCDVFTLLTRYPIEGQPISILEAMGNGMMMITTNHAGIPDIVEHGENGIVFDKNRLDMQQCYQAILNKSVDEMRVIIQKNRETAKNTYNQKLYVENMWEVFRKM